MIAFVKFCKKNSKSLPFPYFNFSIFFFFQKIDERLNEIRRSQKSCTSRSIDFTHVKLKTRSMPFAMYVREFGAAWPNPDFRPFAGRPPVKSKCMGFAGYFARCLQRVNQQPIGRYWLRSFLWRGRACWHWRVQPAGSSCWRRCVRRREGWPLFHRQWRCPSWREWLLLCRRPVQRRAAMHRSLHARKDLWSKVRLWQQVSASIRKRQWGAHPGSCSGVSSGMRRKLPCLRGRQTAYIAGVQVLQLHYKDLWRLHGTRHINGAIHQHLIPRVRRCRRSVVLRNEWLHQLCSRRRRDEFPLAIESLEIRLWPHREMVFLLGAFPSRRHEEKGCFPKLFRSVIELLHHPRPLKDRAPLWPFLPSSICRMSEPCQLSF